MLIAITQLLYAEGTVIELVVGVRGVACDKR